MYKTRTHRRDEANLLAELERTLRPHRRATIVGYAWWWRYEISITLGLGIGVYVLASAVGTMTALIGVAVTAMLLGPWPGTRRAVIASAWRIITPHRLRAGFVQARIHDRGGRLPTILRTTQQPFGERVLVWCLADTSVADFQSAGGLLAAACWATAIRVTRDEGHTNLLTIDVIRHRLSPARPVSIGGDSGVGQLDEPGPRRPDTQPG
jgi:hypothetical protein